MKLIIPKEIEARIHAYAMGVESEIAGMGKVRVEGNDIITEEVMIYEQEVTGATADLSTKALAGFQSELVKAGGSPKHWKLWFHSHDTMAAFFSGRDTDTIDAQTESDWMVSLVVNKRRERKARLDLYRPFRMHAELEIIVGETSFSVPPDIQKEIAEKVKTAYRMGYGVGYGEPSEVVGISLHRHCPMFTQGTRQCYRPYGAGKEADCTTKQFKKRHGANPFMPETHYPKTHYDEQDYTRNQLVSITKTLEGEVRDYENRGLGEMAECEALKEELVDAYYELAGAEEDETIAEAIRAQARRIEDEAYALTGL